MVDNIPWALPATKNGMNTDLYGFQMKGVLKIEAFNCCALVADEMGLGKTIQALTVIYRNNIRPVLVVCPAYLKLNWADEAMKHYGMTCQILSSKPGHGNFYFSNRKLVIINYEILKDWVEVINYQLKPQLIIYDECQYIKNPRAKRTIACMEVGKRRKVHHRIGLSGTPMINTPAELWPILHIIRPDMFPSLFPFAMKYTRPRKNPWGRWQFEGGRNLQQLNRKLRRHLMIRRRKIDVLEDLPPMTHTVVSFELNRKARKEYQTAKDDLITWIRANDPKKLRGALRSEAMVKVGILKQLVVRLKHDQMVTWINDFLENTAEKLVLFCCHKKSAIYPLEDLYGKRCVAVDGDVPVKKRKRQFQRFMDLDRKRLLIGQIQAAGTGWSCTGCSNMGFVELPWTAAELDQACGRIHGINRGVAEFPASYFYFITKDTIEEDIFRLIIKKRKLMDAAIDGEEEAEDTSVFTDLLNRLIGGIFK